MLTARATTSTSQKEHSRPESSLTRSYKIIHHENDQERPQKVLAHCSQAIAACHLAPITQERYVAQLAVLQHNISETLKRNPRTANSRPTKTQNLNPKPNPKPDNMQNAVTPSKANKLHRALDSFGGLAI